MVGQAWLCTKKLIFQSIIQWSYAHKTLAAGTEVQTFLQTVKLVTEKKTLPYLLPYVKDEGAILEKAFLNYKYDDR